MEKLFAAAPVIAATIAGIVVTIFWMVVGWRAMKAHERLAKAAEFYARNQFPDRR